LYLFIYRKLSLALQNFPTLNKVEIYPGEEFRTLEVEGRNGELKYAFSNFGRVVSYLKDIESGKLMQFTTEPNRHSRLKVNIVGGSVSIYIHKVIADFFLPKKDESLNYIMHLNKNIKDNHFQNLQWCTEPVYRQSLVEAAAFRKSGSGPVNIYTNKKIRLFVGEEYKEIQGIRSKKKYAITSFGRLISYFNQLEDGAILKTGDGTIAHNIWHFMIGDKLKSMYIYHLVAEYFIEKPSPLHKYVIHKDHNKGNNTIGNLAWCTLEEQKKHAKTDEVAIERKKNQPFRSQATGKGMKLTVGKVKLIKKILADPKRNTRLKMIAKQFGISAMQLYRIQTGENWAWVKIDEDDNKTK